MASKKEKKKNVESAGSVNEMNPWPEYIQHRLDLWDTYMKQYKEELLNKPSVPIKVTILNKSQVEAEAWKTTPFSIARGFGYVFILSFLKLLYLII